MLTSTNILTNQQLNHSTQHPINLLHLALADTALLLSHRNSEWCGHAPMLEQDIAISNIALDYLGQARNIYQLLSANINASNNNNECTEDVLAYLRTDVEYKNLIITELPNENWAVTICKIFFVSNWFYEIYYQIQNEHDNCLQPIAAKGIKEVQYHVKWSQDWVIRLGDGTQESKQKIEQAINSLWPYIGELFFNKNIANTEINVETLKHNCLQKIESVFQEATLTLPPIENNTLLAYHTEHLGYILTEMQYLQRTYPNAIW